MRSLVIRSVLAATLVSSAAVTATLVDPAVAAASQAPNIIGAYAESDICTSCGGSMFTYSWQITSEDFATGSFSGTESSNAGSGTLTGTITGTSVSMTSTDTSGYTWYPKGTIASDCGLSGSWTDSNSNSGTWQATPESGQCSSQGGGGLYVAMGDSYSAGEGADFASGPGCSFPLYLDPSGSPTNTDYLGNARCIPTPVVPPGPDDTCHRAITAYPHLVASALGLTLKFVACSGAVTRDAYTANHANAIEPAQLSALNPSVRLVTLSFGGNDINFAGVVGGCVTPGKTAVDCIGIDQDELRLLGYDTSVGTANDGRLKSRIDTVDKRQAKSLLSRFGQASGTGASAALLHKAASFSDRLSVHDRLVFLLRAIHELAPEARILILGYPRWFNPGGSSHDVEHFKPLDQRWLNDRIRVADGVMRDAAEQSGVAQYVGVYRSFADHELSNSTTMWPVDADGHAICHGPGSYINGVDFVAHLLFNSPELMHPNPCGHVAFARAVENAFGLPHTITRPVGPVLPPAARIQATSHHSSFFECRETFHAQVASGALSRVRAFDWYNDGGDIVTDVGSGRHATMTMSAHNAFHFLLVIHGTNGQNRYIAYNSNVLC